MVSQLGPLWNLNGPGVTRPALPVLPVGDGTTLQLSFAARGALARGLNVRSDIVNIGVADGVTGRLRTPSGEDTRLAPEMNFCSRRGGCDCPDGSPSPASDYPRLPPGVSYIGAANPDGSGAITVTGIGLDDVCKQRQPRDEGGGGGGGGGGPGLALHALTENGAPFLGTISSGTCSFTGTSFVAKGSGGGYRFSLRIAGARRPGTYMIPIGTTGGTTVTVKGGAGSFSNAASLEGGTGGNGTAVIVPRPVRIGKRIVTRYRLIVGITPLFSGGRPGLAIVPSGGGLKC